MANTRRCLPIASYGIYSMQFNLSCAGLETLPENVSSDLVQRITDAAAFRARKLLDELRSPRLRIIIDPVNLISPERNQKDVLDEAFALLGDAIEIAHAKDRNPRCWNLTLRQRVEAHFYRSLIVVILSGLCHLDNVIVFEDK